MPDRPPPTRPSACCRISRRSVIGSAVTAPAMLSVTMPDAGTSEQAGDAELLALCDAVRRLDASESHCTAKDWDAAVLLVSTMPARTRAALSAKA